MSTYQNDDRGTYVYKAGYCFSISMFSRTLRKTCRAALFQGMKIWLAADEPTSWGLGEHSVKDAEYVEDFLLIPLDCARHLLRVSKHELERMAKAWSI